MCTARMDVTRAKKMEKRKTSQWKSAMMEDHNRRVAKSTKKKGAICVTRKRAQKNLKTCTEETDQLQEERERAVQEQKSQEAESQKGAESQKEEERRVYLSTQTEAQRQVLEEMMPPREGQGTDITCGITVAVGACLKGGAAYKHSRSTCGVAVDACLKGGGGNPALAQLMWRCRGRLPEGWWGQPSTRAAHVASPWTLA